MTAAAFATPPADPVLIPGVIARNPCADDQGYVISTWMRSMRTAEQYRDWSRRRYMARVGNQLDRLLDEPVTCTRFLIASPAARPDRIAGWVCYSPIAGAPTIHYVYVRDGKAEGEQFRRQGLARALLATVLQSDPAGPTRAPIYTHIGPGLKHVLGLYPHAVYLSLEEFLR